MKNMKYIIRYIDTPTGQWYNFIECDNIDLLDLYKQVKDKFGDKTVGLRLMLKREGKKPKLMMTLSVSNFVLED